MKLHYLALVLLAACNSTPVQPTEGAIGFDGPMIANWRAGNTGGSGPTATWQIRADAGAVSSPNVLSMTAENHEAQDRFNLYWSDATRFKDGRISVAVRADDGVIDQGGGPMWRVRDENNYYVCRINPLEANFRVYVVENGERRQLDTERVAIEKGKWHRLEVEHSGDRITCWLDGHKALEATDATIQTEGGVGLWTKADALTSFDDLAIKK